MSSAASRPLSRSESLLSMPNSDTESSEGSKVECKITRLLNTSVEFRRSQEKDLNLLHVKILEISSNSVPDLLTKIQKLFDSMFIFPTVEYFKDITLLANDLTTATGHLKTEISFTIVGGEEILGTGIECRLERKIEEIFSNDPIFAMGNALLRFRK